MQQPTGEIRWLYDEAINLGELGQPSISRASHVEPATEGQRRLRAAVQCDGRGDCVLANELRSQADNESTSSEPTLRLVTEDMPA